VRHRGIIKQTCSWVFLISEYDIHFMLCFNSLAVSIKMNVLLYAPALLVVYLTQLSLFDTIVQLAVCGSLQVFNKNVLIRS
jgi:hypothetical protein